MIVTIDDVRKTGHCVKGAKEWFERHNLDFRDFVKNGITEARVVETGDAIGLEVLKTARKRTLRARRGQEET